MALILTYFNLDLETQVESDTSNFMVATVLSQKYYDRIFKLIAFIAKKIFIAKCNYEIYDKIFLAIM